MWKPLQTPHKARIHQTHTFHVVPQTGFSLPGAASFLWCDLQTKLACVLWSRIFFAGASLFFTFRVEEKRHITLSVVIFHVQVADSNTKSKTTSQPYTCFWTLFSHQRSSKSIFFWSIFFFEFESQLGVNFLKSARNDSLRQRESERATATRKFCLPIFFIKCFSMLPVFWNFSLFFAEHLFLFSQEEDFSSCFLDFDVGEQSKRKDTLGIDRLQRLQKTCSFKFPQTKTDLIMTGFDLGRGNPQINNCFGDADGAVCIYSSRGAKNSFFFRSRVFCFMCNRSHQLIRWIRPWPLDPGPSFWAPGAKNHRWTWPFVPQ